MSTKAEFQQVVSSVVQSFSSNKFCNSLDANQFSLKNYHATLLMIFHQTFEGPSTFALAGAHCPPKLHVVRDYLLKHADEEKSHWQWVIEDLNNTGYTGPDPRSLFAKTACQAYVAFNVYIAIRAPIARLAIATVLESIGAKYGKNYAEKICRVLNIKPEQVYFFFGHGETDVGHINDISQLLDNISLSPSDWDWMCHAAKTAGTLYTTMYNEAMTQQT